MGAESIVMIILDLQPDLASTAIESKSHLVSKHQRHRHKSAQIFVDKSNTQTDVICDTATVYALVSLLEYRVTQDCT